MTDFTVPETPTNGQPMRRSARYRASARVYDLISAEWPVYRAGRVAAIDLMALRPGDRVLDIGCGTGLNFPLVQDRIGPTGSITGVDASAQMLAQARRRTRAAGWDNVRLTEADATALDARALGAAAGFDAVMSTYALSLMPDWPRAVALMTARAVTASPAAGSTVSPSRPRPTALTHTGRRTGSA